jgi:hypothetical protein
MAADRLRDSAIEHITDKYEAVLDELAALQSGEDLHLGILLVLRHRHQAADNGRRDQPDAWLAASLLDRVVGAAGSRDVTLPSVRMLIITSIPCPLFPLHR